MSLARQSTLDGVELMLKNKTQMAKEYGVHPATIDRWVDSGRLPPPINKCGSPRWDSEAARTRFETWDNRNFFAKPHNPQQHSD